ncbi:hypothetical protein [Flavobacterium sp.]|uniref:hypothetical protein n=1 Tax=Flavobacterium sp. TaxID=239 RepID=UPI003BE2C962
MLCPRCAINLIPNNDSPGSYPGALSRTDNQTEICSFCGTDEAIKQTFYNTLDFKISWPISKESIFNFDVQNV